jgi:hypothetical protein
MSAESVPTVTKPPSDDADAGALARGLAIVLLPFVAVWELLIALAPWPWRLLSAAAQVLGRAIEHAWSRIALVLRVAMRGVAIVIRAVWARVAPLVHIAIRSVIRLLSISFHLLAALIYRAGLIMRATLHGCIVMVRAVWRRVMIPVRLAVRDIVLFLRAIGIRLLVPIRLAFRGLIWVLTFFFHPLRSLVRRVGLVIRATIRGLALVVRAVWLHVAHRLVRRAWFTVSWLGHILGSAMQMVWHLLAPSLAAALRLLTWAIRAGWRIAVAGIRLAAAGVAVGWHLLVHLGTPIAQAAWLAAQAASHAIHAGLSFLLRLSNIALFHALHVIMVAVKLAFVPCRLAGHVLKAAVSRVLRVLHPVLLAFRQAFFIVRASLRSSAETVRTSLHAARSSLRQLRAAVRRQLSPGPSKPRAASVVVVNGGNSANGGERLQPGMLSFAVNPDFCKTPGVISLLNWTLVAGGYSNHARADLLIVSVPERVEQYFVYEYGRLVDQYNASLKAVEDKPIPRDPVGNLRAT